MGRVTHLDNPLALTLAQDSMTETRVTPWYRNTIEIDRTRIARFKALIEGRPEPQPTDPPARIAKALLVATTYERPAGCNCQPSLRNLCTTKRKVSGFEHWYSGLGR
jgi:hypothetical protein